jgi:hypothetical protein
MAAILETFFARCLALAWVVHGPRNEFVQAFCDFLIALHLTLSSFGHTRLVAVLSSATDGCFHCHSTPYSSASFSPKTISG